MTSVESLDKSIFILIFPPGTGGNHFANLLSLSDQFQERTESDNYFEYLVNRYNLQGKQNVHVGLENLQKSTWSDRSKILLEKNSIPIICAHANEYSNFLKLTENIEYIKNFKYKQIILFSFPEHDSMAYKRFYPYRNGEGVIIEETDKGKFLLETYKTLYTVEGFKNKLLQYNNMDSKILEKENYKFIELHTDLFVDTFGFEYCKNFIKSNFGVDIPEIGKTLHDIWYKKIRAQTTRLLIQNVV